MTKLELRDLFIAGYTGHPNNLRLDNEKTGFYFPTIHKEFKAFIKGYMLGKGEGEVVTIKNEEGQIVAVTRQDEEGRIIKTLAVSETTAKAAGLLHDDGYFTWVEGKRPEGFGRAGWKARAFYLRPVEPAWNRLSLNEVRDLTAMVWGAPCTDKFLMEVGMPLIHRYESMREHGCRPVDPAKG